MEERNESAIEGLDRGVSEDAEGLLRLEIEATKEKDQTNITVA